MISGLAQISARAMHKFFLRRTFFSEKFVIGISVSPLFTSSTEFLTETNLLKISFDSRLLGSTRVRIRQRDFQENCTFCWNFYGLRQPNLRRMPFFILTVVV